MAGRDDTEAMADFVDQYDVGGFAHVADLGGDVWARYQVTSQPAFAFIDDDGSQDVRVGALGADGLRERIDELVAT